MSEDTTYVIDGPSTLRQLTDPLLYFEDETLVQSWEVGTSTGNFRMFSSDNVNFGVTVNSVENFRIIDGTISVAPIINFLGDTDTSIQNSSANTVSVFCGGTQQLAVTTDSVTVLGTGGTSGVLRIPLGTVSLPSVALNLDTDTGLYSTGAANLSVTAAGVQQLAVTTDSVSVTGAGGTGGRLFIPDGTISLPSIAFTSDTNTGLYSVTTDVIGVTAGGALRFRVGTSDCIATVPMLNTAGTVGAPSISFSSDPDTGIYRAAVNNLGFAAGGVLQMTITTDLVSVLGTSGTGGILRINNGTVGAPSIGLNADTDTGIYSTGTANLSISAGGAQQLAVTTNSVSVTGASGVLSVPLGSVSLPSYTFNGDTNTGLYRPVADNIGIACGGVQQMNITTDVVSVTGAAGVLSVPLGTVSLPSYTFTGDTNTGLYRASNDTVGVTCGGVQQFAVTTNSVSVTGAAGVLSVPDGTVSLPSYSFTSDPDTGFYISAANTIGISCGGVQSVSISTTAVIYSVPVSYSSVSVGLGTVTTPSYTFTGDTNTGIYSTGADNLSVTTGGVQQLAVTTNSVSVTGAAGVLKVPDGTVSLPSYSFTSDPDTGFYISAANTIGIACGGIEQVTISTSAVTFNVTVSYTGISVDAGAVTTPSYTFNGDTNTGIYSSGADVVDITNGGVNSLRINGTAPQNYNLGADLKLIAPQGNYYVGSCFGTYDIIANLNGATTEDAQLTAALAGVDNTIMIPFDITLTAATTYAINKNMRGVGSNAAGRTTITLPTTGTILTFTDCTVENISFDFSGNGNAVAMATFNSNTKFVNCEFINISGGAGTVGLAVDTNADYVYFDYCNFDFNDVTFGMSIGADATNVHFNYCNFSNMLILIFQSGAGTNHTITNCTFDTVVTGLEIRSSISYVKVIGCTFINSTTTNAINLRSCVNIIIDDCSILTCGTNGITISPILSTPNRIIISNTRIDECGGAGISITTGSIISISNCDITDCDGPAIYITGLGRALDGSSVPIARVEITNCNIADTATDGPTTTGGYALTSIDEDFYDGSQIVVHKASNVSISNCIIKPSNVLGVFGIVCSGSGTTGITEQSGYITITGNNIHNGDAQLRGCIGLIGETDAAGNRIACVTVTGNSLLNEGTTTAFATAVTASFYDLVTIVGNSSQIFSGSSTAVTLTSGVNSTNANNSTVTGAV